MPVAAIFLRFASPYTVWEGIFLAVLSPILIPVFAFLALLPQRMLRKREISGYPPMLLAGLTTYWVALVVGLWSMPVAGDSGFDPTPMQALFPDALLGARGATFIFGAAIFLGFLGVLAAFGSAADLREGRKFPRRGWIPTLSALIGVPVLLLGGGMTYTALSLRGETDPAGYREIDVAFFTYEEMEELQREAQEAFNSDLEDVRQALPEANWTFDFARAPHSCAYDCTYKIETTWYTEVDSNPEVVAEILDAHLLNSGWRSPAPDAPSSEKEQIIRNAEQDVKYVSRTYRLGDVDELQVSVQWPGEVFQKNAEEDADEDANGEAAEEEAEDADSAESERRNSSEIELTATRGPFWYMQR